jgi:hypothetical protein
LTIEDKKIVSDKGVKLTFLKGTGLTGEVVLARNNGSVPFKQTFDLRLPLGSITALKSVSWYISRDNQNYTPLGVSGIKSSFTFNEGGVYYVKGQMTNKNSNIVSFTAPATFVANQVYKLSLVGDDLVMPGTVLTQTVSVKNNDGTEANLNDINLVWETTDLNGVKNTFTDVSMISLESAVPNTYEMSVKVKAKYMDGNNPDAWFETKNKLVFFTPAKPVLTVTGPKSVEIGVDGEFKAVVRPPWDADSKTSLSVKGQWTLPDGVTVVPNTFDLTHEILAENGREQTVKYTAWIDGMESSTSTSVTYKFAVTNYIFPVHKLSAVVDSLFAPAYVKLSAVGKSSIDVTSMRGKKLTYTWTLPAQDFIGRGNGYALRGVADKPGTYPFSVVISDARGNSQTLDYTLTLATSAPTFLSMRLTPGQKYNRNPMTYVIKPIVTGGHPKDWVKETIVSVDGVDLPIQKGATKIVTINNSGTHEIGLRVTSFMGASASTSQTVEVNQNAVPVCTLITTWDDARKTARVTPKCTDTDGKLKKIFWFLDGVQLKTSSSNYYFSPTVQKPSAEIKFKVFDDSGDYAEAITTVTK